MKVNYTPKVLCLTFGEQFKVLVNMREKGQKGQMTARPPWEVSL